MESKAAPRRAHAVAQDERILAAARRLLIDRPASSMTEIGAAAGVGMSSLYARFGSKEALLARIADEGNALWARALEGARDDLAAGADARGVLVSLLTLEGGADLAAIEVLTDGMSSPRPHEVAETRRLRGIGERIVAVLHERGALRPGITWDDLGKVLTAVGAVRSDAPERTRALQLRFLDRVLEGLRPDAPPITGPAPEPRDFRWRSRPGESPAGR